MAIQIANNLYRLPTLGSFINSYAFINSDSSVTLVDCGLEGSYKKLIKDLARIGKHPKDVKNIILTHAHDDHVGGAAKMIQECDVKNVLMHEEDSHLPPTGKTPSRDDSRISGKIMKLIPDKGYEPFAITKKLKDGEIIDTAGGLKVIHTPGHTDGHISLLHLESETLITGDSIFNMTSRMTWALSGFCVNYKQSQNTARKFLDLDFKNACFTHGPEIRESGKSRIKQFLSKKGLN
jgi:glyoxylase-like metal-dependent hydrolase (beta-lactamase superfamily II)